jgi:hypothetical protein
LKINKLREKNIYRRNVSFAAFKNHTWFFGDLSRWRARQEVLKFGFTISFVLLSGVQFINVII